MSKSPLAGAFAEGSTPEKKKNKKGAALLIIAGIGLTASVGTVFATNSINLGSGIEFGQGVTDTASCISALETEITQAYETTAGQSTNEFYVDTVGLSGDFSSCTDGSIMNVNLLKADNSVIADGVFEIEVVASGATAGEEVESAAGQNLVITLADQVLANEVAKITVTTE
jgi:hypothetical protein